MARFFTGYDLGQITFLEIPFHGQMSDDLDTNLHKPLYNGSDAGQVLRFKNFAVWVDQNGSYVITWLAINENNVLKVFNKSISIHTNIIDLKAIFPFGEVLVMDEDLGAVFEIPRSSGHSLPQTLQFYFYGGKLQEILLHTSC